MNDPQFFEAARLLADRAIQYAEAPVDRMNFMARNVLARDFDAAELAALTQRLATFHTHYAEHPDDARDVLKTGAHPANPSIDPSQAATWTMLANLILNLDETLVK